MKIPSERFVWACFAFVLTGQAGFFVVLRGSARANSLPLLSCRGRIRLARAGFARNRVYASRVYEESGLREPGMSDADSRKLSLSARLRHVCGRFAAETQLIRIQRACIQHAHS